MKAITKRTIFLEQINARKGRNNWIELLFHETFIIVKMLLEKWCNSYLLWKPWLLPRQKCAARKLERRQGLSPFLLVHPKAALPTSWIFVEASFRLPPMLPINTHQATTLPSYALLQKAQFFFSFFFLTLITQLSSRQQPSLQLSIITVSYCPLFHSIIIAKYPAQMKSSYHPGLQ